VTAPESLPTDLAAAHALILAERAARLEAEAAAANAKAEATSAQADLSSTEALIGHLKLEIEKLRRTLYGTRFKIEPFVFSRWGKAARQP
jgi:transposase